MIDCHAHLADGQFETDIDDVIKAARDGGVRACVLVTENAAEFDRALDLSKRYSDFVALCLGVHPFQGLRASQRCVTLADLSEALPLMEKHLDRLVGVGEIGLDFNPRLCSTAEAKELQREVFRRQCEFAIKNDLPVNVHSCSAGRPAIHLMKEIGVRNAVLHAFDGKPSVAMEGVELGYYFSVPPSIVRTVEKQKLFARIPLENVLLETDSPALGPVKRERNVPANVSISCEFIASVKQLSVDVVKQVTAGNALKLFPKLKRFVRI